MSTDTTKPPELQVVSPETEAPDPFDASRWRLNQSLMGEGAVIHKLTRVPVRKPKRKEFFRVHPDIRINVALIDPEDDSDELFLVAPEIADDVMDLANGYTLYLTITRQGVRILWPVRLPDLGAKANSWHQSAHEAATDAVELWTNIKPNMAAGGYDELNIDPSEVTSTEPRPYG